MSIMKSKFNNVMEGQKMSNYTNAMEQRIIDSAPVTRKVAETLAADFGLSVRSVISKAVLLKVYEKPVKVSSSAKSTKKDLVSAIEKALQGESLDGLENATTASLSALLMSIQ
tara:strand:- start:88 stop:426 length:339 start_codon:yes stop_codon:yes gene_type:complete